MKLDSCLRKQNLGELSINDILAASNSFHFEAGHTQISQMYGNTMEP